MKNRVMVLILGGRLTPNLVGVLAFQPNIVEFIISDNTRSRYDEICEVLTQFVNMKIQIGTPRYLSAYDFISNRDIGLAIAQTYSDAEVIFDVTSAPKIMGFAAYEVARFAHQRIVIVDTNNGHIVDLIPPTAEAKAISVTLRQYLACYGRRPVSTFDFSKLSISCQTALTVADYLANAGLPSVTLLNKLRSWSQGKGKRTIPFKKTKPLSPEEIVVLRKIESFGLLTEVTDLPDGRVSYTILNEMDWKFLEGTWLEVYVWDQGRHCKDTKGSLLFQDCDIAFSFEIPSEGARKEIDMGYVYHGQFIHASCKTEAIPFKTRYLDELRAVSSLVGGRFTSRLFITNAYSPPQDDKDYSRFFAQAGDRGIVVVTGEELPQIRGILEQLALKPQYPRI